MRGFVSLAVKEMKCGSESTQKQNSRSAARGYETAKLE
jgi:hypothetical protein